MSVQSEGPPGGALAAPQPAPERQQVDEGHRRGGSPLTLKKVVRKPLAEPQLSRSVTPMRPWRCRRRTRGARPGGRGRGGDRAVARRGRPACGAPRTARRRPRPAEPHEGVAGSGGDRAHAPR